jgi:dipeptidyl-peptidase 4
MKKNLLSLLSLFFLLSASAQKYNKEKLTTADYQRAVGFLGFNANPLIDRTDVRPNWLTNGNFWYQVSEQGKKEFVLIDPSKAKKKTAASLAELVDKDDAAETMSRRGNASNEVVSPDGKKAVFIRDWNLWMRDLDNKKETQLTKDGTENFGYATDNAGWRKSTRPIVLWSPDSKKIATFQQDQRHVSDMYLVTTNVGAPKLQQWKYPLPEDKDIIRIHRVIIDVNGPKIVRLQMPPDPRRGTLCDDIACSGSFDDNEWSEDASQLAFVSTSRDHKEAKLRIANANTGEVKDVLEEQVATQYESGQGKVNWRFMPGSKEVIWYSEKDDWGHLYLYDLVTGKVKNQITKGTYVVTKLLKVDEKNRVLYFEANGREKDHDPYFSHFYRVDFNGKNLVLLTPEDGNHNLTRWKIFRRQLFKTRSAGSSGSAKYERQVIGYLRNCRCKQAFCHWLEGASAHYGKIGGW